MEYPGRRRWTASHHRPTGRSPARSTPPLPHAERHPARRSPPVADPPPTPPDPLALEGLETEITNLWCHVSAATYRFLELVAEFDRLEGWSYHGCASCAQWLNLTCGIGAVAAREKVRVARALEDLPQVSAAFRGGQLSYSKVRAITRVATPATEATLLNVALYGTASHVERLVRHYRRVGRIEESRQANDRHRDRFLHLRYDDEGSVAIYGQLPAEVGALVEQAIEAASERLFRDRVNADREAQSDVSNGMAGIEVRPPPGWHGECMNYGIAIERMLWEEQRNLT